MQTPAPVTYLSGFQGTGLLMTLNFWIADPVKGKDNVLSAVNLEILQRLRAAKIALPEQKYKVVLEGGVPAAPTRPVKTSVKPPLTPDPNAALF